MSKRGLGRGLSALIPEGAGVSGDRVERVVLERIRLNPYQVRRVFDSSALEELALSIRRQGILQPLLVRRDGEDFLLIAGERRLRAASLAGLSEVPVVVRAEEGEDLGLLALVENVQREDLSPLEEADAYREILQRTGRTQEEVAALVGKSRPHVSNLLRLLTLEPPVRALLAEGRLTVGHCKLLLTLSNGEQVRWARRCAEEGLAVARLAALLKAPPPRPVEGATGGGKVWGREEMLLRSRLERPVQVRWQQNGRGKIEIPVQNREDLYGVLALLGIDAAEG